VSRHHMLPPIVYTPAPPKPRKVGRRRNTATIQGKRAATGVDETAEVSDAAPAHGATAVPQHSLPIEAAERRIHSTAGNLSEDTLRALLQVQEQEGGQASGPTITK
jgi:hypothetical protein